MNKLLDTQCAHKQIPHFEGILRQQHHSESAQAYKSLTYWLEGLWCVLELEAQEQSGVIFRFQM